MTPRDSSILICYDGSAPARAAIHEAAQLFGGSRATVLVVAETYLGMLAPTGPLPVDPALQRDIQEGVLAESRRLADEGTRLAIAEGLVASPLVRSTPLTTWREIVECSMEGSYAAVVVGSRGRSTIRSALLGGVSMGVVAHARRPVVVVHDVDEDAPFSELSERDVAAELPSLGVHA